MAAPEVSMFFVLNLGMAAVARATFGAQVCFSISDVIQIQAR